MNNLRYLVTGILITSIGLISGTSSASDFIVSDGVSHYEISGVNREQFKGKGLTIICEYIDGSCDTGNKDLNISGESGKSGSTKTGKSSSLLIDQPTKKEGYPGEIPSNKEGVPRQADNIRGGDNGDGGGSGTRGGTKDSSGSDKVNTPGLNTGSESSGLSKLLVCDYNKDFKPDLDYLEPGQYGGQCGKYVNQTLDNYAKRKRFGNSLEQKLGFINSQTPVPGAVMIIDSGHRYGHVALVKDVYENGSILVNDSNLVSPNTVGQYKLNVSSPIFPGGKSMGIEGYYIPYSHYFDIVIDRDGNGRILRVPENKEDIRIGLIGNYGKEPTKDQLQKVRETVLALGMKAYELEEDYCTTNFNTGMLSYDYGMVEEPEVSQDMSDEDLMNRICKYGQLNGRTTELCGNWDLYHELKKISDDRGVAMRLMVGISQKESHLGLNFAPSQVCSQSNNRGGVKAKKPDSCDRAKGNKHGVYYYEGQKCWLYPFQDVQEYRQSLANTMSCHYIPKCGNNALCISKNYVGGNGIPSQTRADVVNRFK